jgi:hypothetical protein
MDQWAIVIHTHSIWGAEIYGPFITKWEIDLFINSPTCLNKAITICKLKDPKEVPNGRDECTENPAE